MSNTVIQNGKYRARTDEHHWVIIEDKKGGHISSQSVEALLLLEIVNLLTKIEQRPTSTTN